MNFHWEAFCFGFVYFTLGLLHLQLAGQTVGMPKMTMMMMMMLMAPGVWQAKTQGEFEGTCVNIHLFMGPH